MQELLEFVNDLRVKYSIKDAEFERKLCDHLINNNWFNLEAECVDGKYYVYEIALAQELKAFCSHYNLTTSEKVRELFNLYKKKSDDNAEFLKEYIKEFEVEEENVYYLLNFMIKFMPQAIRTCSNSSINSLIGDALNELTKTNYDILTDFLIWCSQEKNTIYKTITKVTSKSSKLKEAYDLETYGNYLFHFFNEDLIIVMIVIHGDHESH